MPSLPTHITVDRSQFIEILKHNNHKVVFKFGAEWCQPCNRIANQIRDCCTKLPSTVRVCLVDVDENFDLYALLKSKKIVQSIPTLLCYNAGNTTYVPDSLVVGSDPAQIANFFENVASS